MLEFAEKLAGASMDERRALLDIMEVSRELVEADRCALFVVDPATQSLSAHTAEGAIITIPVGSGIAGAVAASGQALNIRDAYADPRFNPEVDKATGYRTRSVLAMPISNSGRVVAVAMLVNRRKQRLWNAGGPPNGRQRRGSVSRRGSAAGVSLAAGSMYVSLADEDPNGGFAPFTTEDEQTFATFSAFIGVTLVNAGLHSEVERAARLRATMLEAVNALVSADMTNLSQVVEGVMLGAKSVVSGDRCAFFLRDKERNELYSKVADGAGKEIRVPMTSGVVGYVARTGEGVNIRDAYADPRFNPEVDKATGYVTRSILAMPVAYSGEVVGVAQIINRLRRTAHGVDRVGEFDATDVSAVQLFAAVAGVCLRNAALYDFVRSSGDSAFALSEALARPAVGAITTPRRGSSLHPQAVPESAVTRLAAQVDTLPPGAVAAALGADFNIFQYHWASVPADRAEFLVPLAVALFEACGFGPADGFGRALLTRFVLTVRAKYRRVPYHSFSHAFDVFQTLVTFLRADGVGSSLPARHRLVLLLCGLCHDLDHMGLNNSYHFKAETPLGILSSVTGARSVLEVHHCNLAVEILSDPLTDVLAPLPEGERRECWKLLVGTILATDMARHGEVMMAFREMVKAGTTGEERDTLVCMMLMKAADISNVTKPFELCRQWGVAVTEEFYRQGDVERESGLAVDPILDRTRRAELANGQLGFIRAVCRPFFNALAEGFPGMRPWVAQLESNEKSWQEVLERQTLAGSAGSGRVITSTTVVAGPSTPATSPPSR